MVKTRIVKLKSNIKIAKKRRPIISNYYKIMSKKIEIGLAERVQLIGLFNNVKGDIETLQSVLEDVKEISILEDEKNEVGFKEVKNEKDEVVSYTWDKVKIKEITLQEKSVAFVNKFMEEKSKNEELSVADAPLMEIYKKLNA